jgi:ribosomal protein L37E
MIFHGEKCRHCGGKMSAPKPVPEGPRAGQTRTFCTKCGHMEYHLPQPPPAEEAVQELPQDE